MTRLAQLEHHEAFIGRHIGPDAAEQAEMLELIGQPSLDALVDAIVPGSIKLQAPLALPAPTSEDEALAKIRAIAAKNQVFRSWIGMGYAGTFTPNVILRNILENPAWYTAYTPYQAEISQGRMEALINFQQMCADLTGMEIANASLLDEATAAAEAMTLAKRSAKSKSNTFLVSGDTHPQTLEVLRTRAEPLGIAIELANGADDWEAALAKGDFFGVLIQYPASSGWLADCSKDAEAIHARGALVVFATDLLALTLLKPPGEMGADIVIGNSQRFGVPFGFGGPHAAFMACRDAYKRSMPGRLIGVSIDAEGKPAYRLTLQTREQHIRREKATSNICTAQVLLAVMASMYAVYHGPDGLKRIAEETTAKTSLLRDWLVEAGADVLHDAFFDTLVVRTPGRAEDVIAEARRRGYQLWFRDSDSVGVSVDETTTVADLQAVASVFGVDSSKVFVPLRDRNAHLPEALRRTDDYLTHPVFTTHRSETAMMRYLKQLADRDYALDRGMIPLGSCTMKLNAATEMQSITWP